MRFHCTTFDTHWLSLIHCELSRNNTAILNFAIRCMNMLNLCRKQHISKANSSVVLLLKSVVIDTYLQVAMYRVHNIRG